MVLLLQLAIFPLTAGLDNGFVRPPLGYNPWNSFGIMTNGLCREQHPWAPQGSPGGCHGFNESVILHVARVLVATNLSAMYKYVNLDCGWSTGYRGADGTLTVNASRYPHGMRWLGDQLHSMGLLFGMYGDAGVAQCCTRLLGPHVNDGSFGHEVIDAKTFASWKVDYLKHDGCGFAPDWGDSPALSNYTAMRDALNATGRPIFYSVHGPSQCGDGNGKVAPECATTANAWRTTGDQRNVFSTIVSAAIMNDQTASASGRGAYNDPDMLEVSFLLSVNCQARVAISSSPLLCSTVHLLYTIALYCTPPPSRADSARLVDRSGTFMENSETQRGGRSFLPGRQ